MRYKTIVKRDGSLEKFNVNKITEVIKKAGGETKEFDRKVAENLSDKVLESIEKNFHYGGQDLTVEEIQDYVEEVLLHSSFKQTAKAYIIYREQRNQLRKPDIFKHRLNLKPYEYPELIDYQHAIQHSYWLHTEYNYTSDIQDFKVNVSDKERNAIKNAMLAVAQVEVAVKNFWGDLHNRMPKPEIGAVGSVFAESEVRHHDSYSHLLEILGLNSEFENISKYRALSNRTKYLTDATRLVKSESNRDFSLSLILFSLFIEHVSLFSQFLVLMSFNKYKNMFKGFSNILESTTKEENLHGQFGIELVKIIREENPEWFDEDMEKEIVSACKNAYEAEKQVINWIYEQGDLEFMPKKSVKEFVKNRLNNSLESLGYEGIFEIDDNLLEVTEFFNDELLTTKHVDFFVKRSVNYTKRTQAFSSDDLFD